MPKIAIIHYKEVDSEGYDCYIRDIVPISSTDWFEVTEDELKALRAYYKPPPRRGYKLNFLIVELANEQEISNQVKNCVQLAIEAKEIAEREEIKRLQDKLARDKKKKAKKEAEEKKLLEELQKKYQKEKYQPTEEVIK